ncbi:MAG: recombination mediator RecR [Cyanobacteria bacterium]|nr:recombination mediator RecR [Cyanobacteriota bacterium]
MSMTLPLVRLIEAFQKLPGVGPKSAQRLAFHVLKQSSDDVGQFAEILKEAKAQIRECPECFNLSGQSPCEICRNKSRDANTLCVVAEPSDIFALERTGEFRGLYHVLHGLISPLHGIQPEDLKIRPLLARLGEANPIREIILALPPSIEGDTTSLYLSRIIQPLGISLTRIAFGLPVGGDLDYADNLTISRALAGRVPIS